MTKRLASKSFGDDYPCQYEWPLDCYIQCGDSGIVLGDEPYYTAFFEAFPKNPSTFLRGEGATVSEAEENTWIKLQRILNCKKHDFKKQEDGKTGLCNHCNLRLSNYFLPDNKCKVCNKEHVYNKSYAIDSKDSDDLCMQHYTEEVLKPDFETKHDNVKNGYKKGNGEPVKEYSAYLKRDAFFYKKLGMLGKIDSKVIDFDMALQIKDKYLSPAHKWEHDFFYQCYRLWNEKFYHDIDRPVKLLRMMVDSKRFRQLFITEPELAEDLAEVAIKTIDKENIPEEFLNFCIQRSLDYIIREKVINLQDED